MKAVLTEESVRVYQDASGDSISITSMRKGDEFDIGKVTRRKKETWVAVTLANGTTGYISGDTRIFAIKKVESLANPVEVYAEKDETSPLLVTIPKRTEFTVRGFEKVEDKDWFTVEYGEGVTGFARAGIKLRVVPEVTRASAKRMMITGGLFTLGGAIMYFVGLNQSASAGDTSFITIGLVLLGLFQVGQGYMQYRQAKQREEKK